MRSYFMEARRNGCWMNTFESSQIIETILPDLLGNKTQLQKAKLTFSGDVNKTVEKFPFEMKLNPEQMITVSKTGDFPIYFTSYQHYWNPNLREKKNDLIITSAFENEKTPYLEGGKETKLVVNLEVYFKSCKS
ncbi:MAG: hypothetical protein MUO72_03390 [Bacteroidales bacterium]|nr:hypothetical protein [Bacteroidales bacterium]